jgi:hypothetical protein
MIITWTTFFYGDAHVCINLYVCTYGCQLYKDSPPSLLEDDLTSLSYYGVFDGAEIFINEAKAVA